MAANRLALVYADTYAVNNSDIHGDTCIGFPVDAYTHQHADSTTNMSEFAVEWQLNEYDTEREQPAAGQRKLLLIAVLASVLLHGALVSMLLVSASRQEALVPVSAVRINLVPTNPLKQESLTNELGVELEQVTIEPVEVPADATPPLEAATEAEVVDPTQPKPEPLAPEVETAAPAFESLVDVPVLDSVPVVIESIANTDTDTATLPSILSVQQTVKAVNAESQAQSWLYECNLLEEEAGVRTCGKASNADYERAARNEHYQALNPVRAASRTRQSLSTVYQNTAGIAGALDASAVPEELADFVLSELEAGTSTYTNNGTNRLQHMRRMLDRSAAGQQAERVLGDAWVRGTAVELQQRKVHID